MGRLLSILGFAIVAALGAAVLATPAGAEQSVQWMRGFHAPGTPKRYDHVGVIKIGPKHAKNVLVLSPGTSAGAAYFVPLAKSLVSRLPGWQVWSVERRENQLEDQSVANEYKAGQVSSREFFDYYLGWVTDSSVTHHVQLIPDSQVGFARDWGMNVELHDLRDVVKAAEKHGGKVVLGGHSLGGTITSAYATWDFDGQAGAKGLSGLVFIDGAAARSRSARATPRKRSRACSRARHGSRSAASARRSPGIFANVGSGLAFEDPNSKSEFARLRGAAVGAEATRAAHQPGRPRLRVRRPDLPLPP